MWEIGMKKGWSLRNRWQRIWSCKVCESLWQRKVNWCLRSMWVNRGDKLVKYVTACDEEMLELAKYVSLRRRPRACDEERLELRSMWVNGGDKLQSLRELTTYHCWSFWLFNASLLGSCDVDHELTRFNTAAPEKLKMDRGHSIVIAWYARLPWLESLLTA